MVVYLVYKYLGVLFTSEGRMERQADRCGVCSNADSARIRRGEEGAEPKGKALDLPVDLRSCLHLWSWALGSDRKNKIAGTSGRNELPPQGGWALPQR